MSENKDMNDYLRQAEGHAAHTRAFCPGCREMDAKIKDLEAQKEKGPRPKGKGMSDEIERLSAEVHGIYCNQYEKNFGKPYRTNGDYALLDEPTKDYDRAFVRWHLAKIKDLEQRLGRAEADLEAYKRQSACQKCGGHHLNLTFCSKCAFSHGTSIHRDALKDRDRGGSGE